MASTIQCVRNFVLIIIILKFIEGIKTLAPISLFCHNGDTNDFFSIGGLVGGDETPIGAILRYIRELAGFRPARGFPLFLCNVF